MRTISVQSMNKIKKAVPLIENKIKIKILVGKNSVSIKGAEYEEFLTSEILRAIDFGFHVEDALLLSQGDYVLEFIEVKNSSYSAPLIETEFFPTKIFILILFSIKGTAFFILFIL